MKHAASMCGMGKFMKRWKKWTHDGCPRCGGKGCSPCMEMPRQGANMVQKGCMQELRIWIMEVPTDLVIWDTFLKELHSWYSGTEQMVSHESAQAVSMQSDMGWAVTLEKARFPYCDEPGGSLSTCSLFLEGNCEYEWYFCQSTLTEKKVERAAVGQEDLCLAVHSRQRRIPYSLLAICLFM